MHEGKQREGKKRKGAHGRGKKKSCHTHLAKNDLFPMKHERLEENRQKGKDTS